MMTHCSSFSFNFAHDSTQFITRDTKKVKSRCWDLFKNIFLFLTIFLSLRLLDLTGAVFITRFLWTSPNFLVDEEMYQIRKLKLERAFVNYFHKKFLKLMFAFNKFFMFQDFVISNNSRSVH